MLLHRHACCLFMPFLNKLVFNLRSNSSLHLPIAILIQPLELLSNGLQYVGQRNTQLIQVHIIHPSLHSKQLAYSTAHVHQSQSKAWILLHQSLLYYFPVYHLDLGVRVGIGGTHYKNRLTKNPHKVSLLDYILGIQCQVSNQYKSPVYI